jgi:hypothetical protein
MAPALTARGVLRAGLPGRRSLRARAVAARLRRPRDGRRSADDRDGAEAVAAAAFARELVAAQGGAGRGRRGADRDLVRRGQGGDGGVGAVVHRRHPGRRALHDHDAAGGERDRAGRGAVPRHRGRADERAGPRQGRGDRGGAGADQRRRRRARAPSAARWCPTRRRTAAISADDPVLAAFRKPSSPTPCRCRCRRRCARCGRRTRTRSARSSAARRRRRRRSSARRATSRPTPAPRRRDEPQRSPPHAARRRGDRRGAVPVRGRGVRAHPQPRRRPRRAGPRRGRGPRHRRRRAPGDRHRRRRDRRRAGRQQAPRVLAPPRRPRRRWRATARRADRAGLRQAALRRRRPLRSSDGAVRRDACPTAASRAVAAVATAARSGDRDHRRPPSRGRRCRGSRCWGSSACRW